MTIRQAQAVRLLFALVALAAAALWSSTAPTATADGLTQTPPNFKVALVGDQSIGPNAEAVLTLIKDEGADMLLLLGDYAYGDESDQAAIDWDAQLTAILGADFPAFGPVGNHDVAAWATYRQLLLDRLALISGAVCIGDYGVNAACTYQGLFFVLSGAGTMGADHTAFIESELAKDDSLWRICAWHKNQHAMQLGLALNEVGWGPYEACRKGRAIIATGHEHSYSRTKTLINMRSRTIDPAWPDADELRVSKGSTFAFVSGMGGQSVRPQIRCRPTSPPYGCDGEWASIYTSSQGATYGALFIEFNVDGQPDKANGYFKDINGNVADTFTVWSGAPKEPSELPPFKCYLALGRAVDEEVALSDQFSEEKGTLVKQPVSLCNAASKNGGGAEDGHLVCYRIEQQSGIADQSVDIDNQFGQQTLTIHAADRLCVQSQKGLTQDGANLHLKCYPASGPSAGVELSLTDQYDETGRTFQVRAPESLCAPVSKHGNVPLSNAVVCYRIGPFAWHFLLEQVVNQFNDYRPQPLLVLWAATLCVPSAKLYD